MTLAAYAPTHLSLFVLRSETGQPVTQLPCYAEVGLLPAAPSIKVDEDGRLDDVIMLAIRAVDEAAFADVPRRERLVRAAASSLAILTRETRDALAADPESAKDLVIAVFERVKQMSGANLSELDDDQLPELLNQALRNEAAARDLPVTPEPAAPARAFSASYPLGILATDHMGYLSFDLTRLPTDVRRLISVAVAALRRDRLAATSVAIWVYPGGRDEDRIDALTQCRFALDAIVVKLAFVASELPLYAAGHGLLSLQCPALTDWRLSPASFASRPGTLVGDDGCETLLPASQALQEFFFYQIVRLTNVAPTPADPTGTVKLGVSHEYRIAWYSLGHSLGELLYSLPLAPGESTNVAVVDWTRRDNAQRAERTVLDEQLVHNEHRDRAVTETVNAAVREYQHGSSFMAGIAGSVGAAYGGGVGAGVAAGIAGSLGGSTSSSSGARDIAASTVQRLSDNITQTSSAMRELQSTVVVHATQAEKESVETRTVANYNHSHALTILYYEVLRHFRVVTELGRWRPSVLVRTPLEFFMSRDLSGTMRTVQTIQNNRAVLEAALLDPTLADGLHAIDRILHRSALAEAAHPAPHPAPPDPGDRSFQYFEIAMKTGNFVSEGMNDHGRQIELDCSLLRGAEPEIYLADVRGRSSHDPPYHLNHFGSFRVPNNIDKLVGMLKTGDAPVPWKTIEAVVFTINPDDHDDSKASFSHITVTGVDTLGQKAVLVDEGYEDGHLIVTSESAAIAIPVRPPDAVPAPPPRSAEELEDEVKRDEVMEHLRAHRAYYARAIILNQDPTERAVALDAITLADGSTLLEHVENRPLDMIGQYVAYPCTDIHWTDSINAALKDDPRSDEPNEPDERLVTLPTRGVFAEAKLGHCNASEKIDNTRFWDWQQSPIPHYAPDIAPVQTVVPQPKPPEGLAPTAFPGSLVNIVNPPAAPDPTGLGAALTAASTASIFRDMSGRAEVADLLKKLSDNSVAIAQAAGGARTGSPAPKPGTGSTTSGPSTGSTAPVQRPIAPPSAAQQESEHLDNHAKAMDLGERMPPADRQKITDHVVKEIVKPKVHWTVVFTSEWLGESVQQPMLATYYGALTCGQSVDDVVPLAETTSDETIYWEFDQGKAPLSGTIYATAITPPGGALTIQIDPITVAGRTLMRTPLDMPLRADPTLPDAIKYTIPRIQADARSPRLFFHGIGEIKKKEIELTFKVNAAGKILGETGRELGVELPIDVVKAAIKATLKAAVEVSGGAEATVRGTFEVLYLKGYEIKQVVSPP